MTFTNTTGSPAVGVKLSISVPSRQWTSVVPGTTDTSQTFRPGRARRERERDLQGHLGTGGLQRRPDRQRLVDEPATRREAIRDNGREGAQRQPDQDQRVPRRHQLPTRPTRSSSSTTPATAPSTFRNWTLTEHPAQQPIFSTVTVPAGTKLAGHGFYLLGLSNSGLAAPASAGDTTINLSNTSGLAPGQQVQIGTGPAAETRTITHITNSGATGPRVPGKIGNAVQLSGNGEYVDLPSGIVSGLHDFTISAWVNPSANSAWSRVFDFGTGTSDYMFLTLSAGGGPLRFADHHQRQWCGAADQRPRHAAAEHLVARGGDAVRHHRDAVRQRPAGGDQHQHDPHPRRSGRHQPELDRPFAVQRRPVPGGHRGRLPDLRPRAVRRRHRHAGQRAARCGQRCLVQVRRGLR